MLNEFTRISSGSYDLNSWLYGGYEKDVITMIAGPAGSGKTNFSILASCSQAKKGKKVIFMDTEGGFSVERVKQIVGENYNEILENIFLLKCWPMPVTFRAFSTVCVEELETTDLFTDKLIRSSRTPSISFTSVATSASTRFTMSCTSDDDSVLLKYR